MEIARVMPLLEKQVQDMFRSEKSGHDIWHLRRTMNLALRIQEEEGGDRFVIALAAFLHDVHRIIQADTGAYCAPAQSLSLVREMLRRSVLGHEAQIERILSCIDHHEEYDFSEQGKTVSDIETFILQDADNLDAMGAIGVARAFMFGGANGIPMWTPEIPFASGKFDEGENDPSEVHHFYSKVLQLKDNMNTATGKVMAEKRHAFLESFLAEFFAEWKGEV